MEALADAMNRIAQISSVHLATSVSKTSSVMRPAAFKGGSSADACRFLAGFTMWAMTQGTSMNVVDHLGNAVRRCDADWIRTILSLMEDEASIWAAPSMKQFKVGAIPFGGDWT
jgi:hypothetical protein